MSHSGAFYKENAEWLGLNTVDDFKCQGSKSCYGSTVDSHQNVYIHE